MDTEPQLAELRALIARHAVPGEPATRLPGIRALKATATTAACSTMYQPAFGIVVQGAKRTVLNDRLFDYGAGQYLIVSVELPARGLHYAVDAAAASATARLVLGNGFDTNRVVQAFGSMRPAYGRGEVIPFGDESVEFVMCKNGPSLQLNLDSLSTPPQQVMFALDEGTPDISWIYDVDFDALDHVDVVTGEKSWQVALRLAYAGVPVTTVEPDLEKAIELMRALPAPEHDRKLWFVNYEQMMLARKYLGFPDLETRL